jgi:hypothetical protein
MDNQTIFEIIGYLASTIIAISLLMKSLIRLRIVNGIGALFFVIYGILIQAYPVAILNGIIVVIDIYYLLQMLKRSDYFTLMEVSPNSTYLNFFLEFHTDDIQNFFPDFNYLPEPPDLVFFVLRNTIPAGLVILRKQGNKGKVLLDYALKDYRDFKIGSFIFDDNADLLISHGINYLETPSQNPDHIRYLLQMGFLREENNNFSKQLTSRIIRDKKF